MGALLASGVRRLLAERSAAAIPEHALLLAAITVAAVPTILRGGQVLGEMTLAMVASFGGGGGDAGS